MGSRDRRCEIPARHALLRATAILVCALLAGAPALGAERTRIVLLGADGYPPYSFAGKRGTAEGLYAELLRRLAAELPEFEIELRPTPWTRALHEVELGHADGVYPPYRKPELRPWMRYSEPLIAETVVVICHRDIADRLRGAAWPRGYGGLRFGNTAGFLLPGKEFFAMTVAGEIVLEETRTTENNLRKLQSRRIDCYADERFVLASELHRLQIDPGQFVETSVIGTELGYIGFGSAATDTPARQRFMEQLDAAIRRLRGSEQLMPLPATAP
jgi:polar amino acid transport system substrate-binding protein